MVVTEVVCEAPAGNTPLRRLDIRRLHFQAALTVLLSSILFATTLFDSDNLIERRFLTWYCICASSASALYLWWHRLTARSFEQLVVLLVQGSWWLGIAELLVMHGRPGLFCKLLSLLIGCSVLYDVSGRSINQSGPKGASGVQKILDGFFGAAAIAFLVALAHLPEWSWTTISASAEQSFFILLTVSLFSSEPGTEKFWRSLSFPASYLVLGGLLIAASLLYQHEYFYFLSGQPNHIPHPEHVGSLYGVLLLLWLKNLLGSLWFREERFQPIFTIALVLGLALLPPIEYAATALVVKTMGEMPWHAWIVGYGASWRAFLNESELAVSSRAMQFGIPALLTVWWSSGLLGIGLLIGGGAGAIHLLHSKTQRIKWAALTTVLLALPGGVTLPCLGTYLLLLRGAEQTVVRQADLVGTYLPTTSVHRRFKFLRLFVGLTLVVLLITGISLVVGLTLLSQPPRIIPTETPQNSEEDSFFAPESSVLMLIASEDVLYFTHPGVDLARLRWVIEEYLAEGHRERGASTLTMQLIKIQYLSFEKTALRKLLQIIGAVTLEASSSKSAILEEYLSVVSFGPGVYGIRNAARHYFQKTPNELSPEEQEKLILTIENPLRYTPHSEFFPPSMRLKRRQMLRNVALFREALTPAIRTLHFVKKGSHADE